MPKNKKKRRGEEWVFLTFFRVFLLLKKLGLAATHRYMVQLRHGKRHRKDRVSRILGYFCRVLLKGNQEISSSLANGTKIFPGPRKDPKLPKSPVRKRQNPTF